MGEGEEVKEMVDGAATDQKDLSMSDNCRSTVLLAVAEGSVEWH